MTARTKTDTREETADASLTIRIPQSLKERIDACAAAEGLTMSSWLKKAAEYALENMDITAERKFSRESLISLIENDPGVADVLRRKVYEAMNIADIRTTLLRYRRDHRQYRGLDDEDKEDLYGLVSGMYFALPRSEGIRDGKVAPRLLLHYRRSLTVHGDYVLKWDDKVQTLADFPLKKRFEPADFFCMEASLPDKETGNMVRTGLYLWCGTESPDIRKIALQAKNAEVRIYRGRLFGFENDGRIDRETGEREVLSVKLLQTVCKNVCAALRSAARSYAGLGPEIEIDSLLCREFEIMMQNRYFPYMPPYVSVQWYSENLKNGVYKSEREFVNAVVQKHDASLKPRIETDFEQEFESDASGLWLRDKAGKLIRIRGRRAAGRAKRAGMMNRMREMR
ncbi:MAG TPA: hypothetical protein O0X70_01705 [Methanocorpusculum sp.]|nr:hypothetical protein [Methanocorpusculum sp.]